MRSSRASNRFFALAAILAVVTVASTCGKDTTGPAPAGPAAAMQIVAGDQQPAQVGTELPSPLVVKVLDAQGRVVPGQVVNFRVTSGGGSVFAGVASTNDSGVARERWTLGTSTADSQRVEARAVDNVTGAPLTFATFKATAIPGPAASASIPAGGSQSGSLGTVLPESLTVRVVDRYTNPVSGQWMRWSVRAGGGSLSAESTATRADGVAKVTWSLGPRLDTTHVARAVVGTVATLQFTATPQLPGTATITKTAGDVQTDTVGHAVPVAPSVIVKLADARPVAGATVTFAADSGGGSATGTTAITNASGVAAVGGWTLGTSAGSNRLRATVSPLPPVLFTATVVAGPPAVLSVVAGNAQTGPLGAPLTDSVAVKVADQYANPVGGKYVRWLVAAGGGTAGTDSSLTGTDGVARARWTLGTRLDTTHVLVASLGTLASVRATATPQLPGTAVFAKTAGDAQTNTVATALLDSLGVSVMLADGRPVVGARVRWSAGSGNGSVRDSVSETGTSGDAGNRWTMGTAAGSQALVASVAGLANLTFSATALPGPAASVSTRAGAGQSTTVGAAVTVAPSVTVRDAYANVVAGAVVAFGVASGGGSVTGGVDTTGSDGIAAVGSWTLGTTAGTNSLSATVSGLTPVSFSATGTAGPAFAVTALAGNNQSQQVAALVDVAPSVKVTDSYGNGVPGVTVTFSVSVASGGGAITDSVKTTDSAGVASVGGWRLGINPGGNALTATASGLSPTSFAAQGQALAFSSAATGEVNSCGVTSTGVMYCWGWSLSSTPRPQVLSQRFAPGGEAVGKHHVCALTTTGQTYCWNVQPVIDYGQRGTGSGGGDGLVATSLRFAQLSSGFYTTCGLTSDGTAYCWGYNSAGQIGDSTTANRVVPVQVRTSVRFTSLSVGTDHVCGVATDGLLFCWGGNSSGQLGVGDNIERLVPTAALGSHRFVLVSTGYQRTCAIATDGLTYCVGDNGYGSLGPIFNRFIGGNSSLTFTVPIDSVRPFSNVAVSDFLFNCAVGTDHVGSCWGYNYAGMLGTGSVDPGQGPLGTVAGGLSFESLSSGYGTTCGRTSAGTVYCWGQNNYGQMGIGVTSDYSTVPRLVLGQQ
jgi:hypothetical protein